jgi:hypothetical protein
MEHLVQRSRGWYGIDPQGSNPWAIESVAGGQGPTLSTRPGHCYVGSEAATEIARPEEKL